MANTYLTRTTWGTPTSKKTFTFSFWFKNSKIYKPDEEVFLTSLTDPYASNNRLHMSIDGSEQLKIEQNDLSGYNFQVKTNRIFMDPAAWYHAVFKVDTTQSVEANRFKMYINGVQETSFAIETMPSLDLEIKVPETDRDVFIGSWSGGAQFWDGYMAYFYYTDGYAYDASTFGSFDGPSGEWKINTSPSVSYGTNGFLIMEGDNTITDQSSNSNDFTLGGGTLTATEDSPSDTYACWNPSLVTASTMSLAYGNTHGRTSTSYAAGASNSYFSTLGMTKGKFYAEIKPVTDPGSVGLLGVGFDLESAQRGTTASQYNMSYTTLGFSYNSNGSLGNDGDGWTSTGYDSYTTDDILGVAIDLDNNKLYVSKNGTWQNSADPSAGTGGFSITADKQYFFGISDNAEATQIQYNANFGNGYFGTSAISSEGTNASGIGKFEYDVPTGFTALSTKGLNS